MKNTLRRMMRFSIRDVFWLFTIGLILALVYVKGAPPPPPHRPPLMPNSQPAGNTTAQPGMGRYQMVTDTKSGYLLLIDTTTGRIWKFNAEKWPDGELPPGTP